MKTAIGKAGCGSFWLRFFLAGVSDSATNAAVTATRIHQIRERDRQRLLNVGGHKHELALLNRLDRQPIVNGAWMQGEVGVAKATANQLLVRMEDAGISRVTTGCRRNRLFRNDEYVDVLDVLAGSGADTIRA